jgi:hypothetical protein
MGKEKDFILLLIRFLGDPPLWGGDPSFLLLIRFTVPFKEIRKKPADKYIL